MIKVRIAGLALLGATLIAAGAASAHSVDVTKLPLGDNKVSDHAEVGFLWACHTDPQAGGAQVEGPWIDSANGTWNLEKKVSVSGSVTWPHSFEVGVDGDQRIFGTNDLPDHATGVFPIASNEEAYKYDRNPNHIAEQDFAFDLPANPAVLDQPLCAPGAVGVLLSGVVLFNAVDAPGRDAVAHETQDSCQGHPQEGSVYHYHNVSRCVLEALDAGTGPSKLVGYAVDGFGIYGPRDENGEELSSDDLDECHGRVSDVEWDGKVVKMYHYVATLDFPYTVGCMRGAYSNDDVMTISGPRLQAQMGQPRSTGGPDLAAAAAKLGISEAVLVGALGAAPPNLSAAATKLGISQAALSSALGL